MWDKVAERVQALLADSAQWTGGKQRLTATRLHALLVAEGHTVGVTAVKDAVAEWKRQRREVFVPLTYRPGDLAEVDFFEVLVDLDGTRRKAWLFLMRLMYSGRDFARIYERQDQISFLDGHVRAFAHFDGVPARVAYDNLRAAVVRILVGGARTLTPRFTALASHYLLEACFCRPGEGHDKGGVEARGQAIRQQTLVPIPSGPTLTGIFAGPIGTGKTHLAIALGVEATKQKRRVLFTRAADLVRQLLEARDTRELTRLQQRLLRVDVLIVDELGFVPFDRIGGELLFNLLTDRYERRAIVVTTNLAFAEWVTVFAGDEKLTTALLDCLAHHATVLTTKGKSYRMRKRRTREEPS